MSMNSMQGFVLEKQLLGTYLSSETPQYLPYKEALRKATRLTSGKLVSLLERLGLKAYYSRAMDFYHGVDVIIVDPKNRAYITADISNSPKTNFKADINIVPEKADRWAEEIQQVMQFNSKSL